MNINAQKKILIVEDDILIAGLEQKEELFKINEQLNITNKELKKIQNEMLQREIKLLSMAEMTDIAPNSITVHDYEGNFLYANRKTFELHGYSKEEFMKLNLHNIDVPQSEKMINEKMNLIKQRGNALFEAEHFKKDKTIMPLEIFVKSVEWEGKPALLSIATDITERQKISNALKQSEKRFKSIFEKSMSGIFYINVQGGILEANPKIIHMLGALSFDDVKAINVLKHKPLIKAGFTDDFKKALLEAKNRMQSMGLLYQKLYKLESFKNLHVKQYLDNLIDEIVNLLNFGKKVKIIKNIYDFEIDLDMILPIGIIVNELITNAFKYAYTDKKDNILAVSTTINSGTAVIIIEDNGCGINESIDFKNSKGLGLQLVGMLIEQIKGTVKIERKNGTKFTIEIKI